MISIKRIDKFVKNETGEATMRTQISGSDLQELAIEIDHPDNFQTGDSLVLERNYQANNPRFMDGSYKEFFFEGIHIGYGDFRLPRTTLLHYDSEMGTIEMHFALEGKARTNSNSFNKEVKFDANQHNLVYAHEFKGTIEWCSQKDVKVFEVNLWPSFFKRFLPKGKLFDLFQENIERKNVSLFSPHNYPITPKMKSLILQILNCNRTGHFKRMFLESHVIELLMLQLEQISDHTCNTFCPINKQLEEKLYAVREILSQQLTNDLTLNNLARQVGTNDFALKKGFKELFGTTVFKYWNEIKMQEARTLLLEGMMNVNQVSTQVGYKNPQHFSTAFKRRFGYSPRELKS